MTPRLQNAFWMAMRTWTFPFETVSEWPGWSCEMSLNSVRDPRQNWKARYSFRDSWSVAMSGTKGNSALASDAK